MSALENDKKSVGDFHPALKEGNGPLGQNGGIQQVITVPLGPPLLVDSATYKGVAFIAPCNGCQVKEIWIAASVKIASGTNTLAIDNYDKSATTARNVQSAATIDPDTVTALQGTKLTLSATAGNLIMDEGDVLNYTLVAGTQTTAGQGYALTAIIIVPDLI
jgi:hypothetical protein